MTNDTPHLLEDVVKTPTLEQMEVANPSSHPPRILLLYGSLRERSFSRLVTEECARILEKFGCEVKTFDPHGLPLVSDEDEDHPKVKELRDLVIWSEGQVWSSPERHGAMTGVMKTQIDWLPLSVGAVRPTQGKTLAIMQVEGGSQSFNTVNQLRILGRWMRMLTIPNQSSIARTYNEFDENNRIKDSSFYERLVDVMEELVKFTLLVRDRKELLVDRYSERKAKLKKAQEAGDEAAIAAITTRIPADALDHTNANEVGAACCGPQGCGSNTASASKCC